MSLPSSTRTNTLIASHNAGGAAVLASWVKYNLHPDDCIYALNGPAVAIFAEILPDEFAPHQKSLFSQQPVAMEQLQTVSLDYFDQVITSTSAQDTQWETRFIEQAARQHVPCYSMLDHWTNYQSRFLLNGEYIYPDEIWVNDSYGLAIAQKIEGYPKVKIVPPYYLQDQAVEIQLLRKKNSKSANLNILFVSEPSTNPLYTEFDVLKDFLHFVAELPLGRISVRLRLHPREAPEKYDAIVANWQKLLNVHLSVNSQLKDDCAWAQWVVGCQTMAMVVALMAGLKVSCCLPASVAECALPHREIERLFPPVGGTQIARAS